MKRIKRVVAVLLAAAMTVSLSGCGLFETMSGMSKDKPTSFSNVNDLESGKAYVWKDAEGDDIQVISTLRAMKWLMYISIQEASGWEKRMIS